MNYVLAPRPILPLFFWESAIGGVWGVVYLTMILFYGVRPILAAGVAYLVLEITFRLIVLVMLVVTWVVGGVTGACRVRWFVSEM